jgi:error-prone DNA polymerase
LEDLVNRADLGERALTQLAEAGALACFGVERREALWKVTRLARQTPIPLPLDDPQPEVELDPLDVLSTIAWDYRATDHSPRGHLLGPLRAHLAMQRLPPAEELNRLSDGARTRYVGLVICRQRPGTANGVVFMTLEDETGFVNLVVWEQVFERYRVLAKTEPFLGITGRVQAQHGVVHLIADHLWRPTLPLRAERSRSRDFH